jgi:hypothetical protein
LTIHSHQLVRTIVARNDCVKRKVMEHSSYGAHIWTLPPSENGWAL